MIPMGDAAELPIVDVHCGWGATSFAPGWEDAEYVGGALRARGIGGAFLASDLARHFDPISGNEQVAQTIGEHPHFSAWLVVHPDRPLDAHAQMRRFLYGDQFVGCALYPDPATGRPITLEGAHDIVNAFRRFGKPLLIETPNAEAMHHAARIAQEMGNMRIVASGMGGAEWREAVDLAAHLSNLYLDISGALVPDKIDYAARALHGVRKLLFASGAPQTDPAAVIGLLDDLDLTPDDRERILGGNAVRLFDLDAGQQQAEPELLPLAEEAEADEDTPHLETLAPDEFTEEE